MQRDNLQRASDQCDASDRLQIFEGKLDADREEQQRDADLRQQFDVVDSFDRRARP